MITARIRRLIEGRMVSCLLVYNMEKEKTKIMRFVPDEMNQLYRFQAVVPDAVVVGSWLLSLLCVYCLRAGSDRGGRSTRRAEDDDAV